MNPSGQSDFDRRIRPDEMVSTVKGQTKQSKRIPLWLWLIIAKSLGIRLNAKDKPILAWALHLLTVISAGGWFKKRRNLALVYLLNLTCRFGGFSI
jgi:hypothetical protein